MSGGIMSWIRKSVQNRDYIDSQTNGLIITWWLLLIADQYSIVFIVSILRCIWTNIASLAKSLNVIWSPVAAKLFFPATALSGPCVSYQSVNRRIYSAMPLLDDNIERDYSQCWIGGNNGRSVDRHVTYSSIPDRAPRFPSQPQQPHKHFAVTTGLRHCSCSRLAVQWRKPVVVSCRQRTNHCQSRYQ